MKKYVMSIVFLLICLSFLFVSCEKENPEKAIQTPCDLNRKYMLIDLHANFPIDLNFDGIENVDLMKEIDVFQDCFIYFTDTIITIAWPEAQVGQYPLSTSEIPSVYTGQEIKYSVVPSYYTYSTVYWEVTYARVYPKEKREGLRNYYGLTPPTMMEVDKEQNTISFSYAGQNFMTKEGIKARQITAVYRPNPTDNYFR